MGRTHGATDIVSHRLSNSSVIGLRNTSPDPVLPVRSYSFPQAICQSFSATLPRGTRTQEINVAL